MQYNRYENCMKVYMFSGQLIEVTLLDLGVSGAGATGAVKCLEHIFDEMKGFAKTKKLYMHMTALTRTLLAWKTHADFPSGCLAFYFELFYEIICLST